MAISPRVSRFRKVNSEESRASMKFNVLHLLLLTIVALYLATSVATAGFDPVRQGSKPVFLKAG